MMVLRRTALPLINAVVITLILFAMMYSLIYVADPQLQTKPSFPKIAFNYVEEDPSVNVIVAKLNKPEEVAPQPDVIVTEDTFEFEDLDGGDTFTVYTPTKYSGTNSLPIDNQLVIALGFPPEYPRGQLQRNVEGYAVVGFSVNAAGAVYDEYIIESEPGTAFDRSSLKAISKFKYKARVVDGRAVNTTGQRYMFSYKIDG